MIKPPVLEVKNVCREFPAGDSKVVVLKDINLKINPGELVAIVGQSGSGKSTLMNILGCLDKASSGSYFIDGKDIGKFDGNELASLRREHFGFIFQRYHLLGDLSAAGNVEVPSIYAGADRKERSERSQMLLSMLGLEDKVQNRPSQLSGGQQQRVSIARALMNGGEIVFADEPTGALDSKSGAEVMAILKGLNEAGHTVIMVTHDKDLAEHCKRIIEIKDGMIIDDRAGGNIGASSQNSIKSPEFKPQGGFEALLDSLSEAFSMAVLSMRAHKLRTFLTMLGIIIGIASVVSVVALGEGSKQKVLNQISSIGTNTLEIMPGSGFGDMRSGAVKTLVTADADALEKEPYVDSVTPIVQTSKTVQYEATSNTGTVQGVGTQYFRVKGLEIDNGRLFTDDEVKQYAQNAVIDQNTLSTIFDNNADEAMGKELIIGGIPVRIIGVLKSSSSGFGMNSSSMNIYMPYTAVNSRILGTNSLRSVTVRIKDSASSDVAENGVVTLLTKRHGSKDFFIINTDQIRQTITATTQTLTILISAIAIISLIVGGIGVMNIMLVSVTERTSEIGVRMAVGARTSDILQQFLIEAVLVCLLGGILGILLSLLFGVVFGKITTDYKLIYSPVSIALAFLCSTLIGVIFGYLPARSAAKLDPVVALSRD